MGIDDFFQNLLQLFLANKEVNLRKQLVLRECVLSTNPRSCGRISLNRNLPSVDSTFWKARFRLPASWCSEP